MTEGAENLKLACSLVACVDGGYRVLGVEYFRAPISPELHKVSFNERSCFTASIERSAFYSGSPR